MVTRYRHVVGRHPGFALVTAATVALLLCWLPVDFWLRQHDLVTPFGFNDFGAYVQAVDRWEAGEVIYERDDVGGFHGSFLYPPVALLAYYPFTTFDFYTGATLFGATSLVLLWVGLDAVVRALGYRPSLGERLLALPTLFAFQPALRDFKWAQTATLLAAVLCFAFYAQELGTHPGRSRPFRFASGALTSLASAFKLFFATSGAHLLRDRDRLAGALATAVALLVASVALFGLENHATYLEVLAWGKGWGESLPPSLWDTSAAYRPLYVAGSWGLPLRVLGVVAVVGLALAGRRSPGRVARWSTFALGVAAIPLLAPRADIHDLVVLLLPAVLLVAVEFEVPDGRPWVPVLAISLVHAHRYVIEVVIHPPSWLPAGGYLAANAAWFQPAMWATFVLVGLAAYRLAQASDIAAAVTQFASHDEDPSRL
ncbi:MAG: glycosyltransferase family 87 protein [Halobacteriales archaeon]